MNDEGEFANGKLKMHRYCVYMWNDGCCYEGEFVNGLQDGYGIYTWPTGGVYKGYWKNDKITGFGRYRNKDGASYHGTWLNNNQFGRGKKICPLKIHKNGNWKMVPERMYHEVWGKNRKLLIQMEITKPIFRRDTRFVDCIIVCE